MVGLRGQHALPILAVAWTALHPATVYRVGAAEARVALRAIPAAVLAPRGSPSTALVGVLAAGAPTARLIQVAARDTPGPESSRTTGLGGVADHAAPLAGAAAALAGLCVVAYLNGVAPGAVVLGELRAGSLATAFASNFR